MKKLFLRFNKLFAMASVPSLWPLLRHRIFPSLEHSSVLNDCISDCSFVIDVGANVGQFLLAVHIIDEDIPVFSYEPNHHDFRLLSIVSSIHPYSKCYCVGLSDHHQFLSLNLVSSSDSSSFLAPSKLQLDSFNQSVVSISDPLELRQLDSYISNYNEFSENGFLKIDVQGFELKVLRGAKKLIASFVKYIYVELSLASFYCNQDLAGTVINELSSLNFVLVGVYNPHLSDTREMLQADFLFKKVS